MSGKVAAQGDEIRKIGQELNVSSDAISKETKKISENMITSGDCGRDYSESGKKLESGFQELQQRLTQWGKALQGDGAAMGVTATEYTAVDAENKEQIAKSGAGVKK